MVAILVFILLNFKEEQVPSAAIDALAGQLVLLSYLVFFTCRHMVCDVLVFVLCELQGSFESNHFIVESF